MNAGGPDRKPLSQTQQNNAGLFERARRAMPGGISHELRWREPHPLYIRHAEGALKWDEEGRAFIDFKMGSASQMLGHCHPDVTAAVCEQMQRTPFAADCHLLEIEWAEAVNALFPSAEMTRFTGSGSEATLLAVRLGRAFTGKPKLLRIDGHYHGWHDPLLAGARPGSNTAPPLGVPAGVSELTRVAPPEIGAIQTQLEADPEIGTVIVEVSGASYGAVPLPDGFLAQLRALTLQRNVVLIFDEIITGFRWSPGGLQARDGIVPDLTTLAKVLTGGLPGGAVCGRADILALLDPATSRDGRAPPVCHKGTFNASPLVASAALAALGHLRSGEAQAQADAMAERLRRGFTAVLQDLDMQGTVYGESSTFHIHLGPVSDRQFGLPSARDIAAVPKQVVTDLRNGLIARGVDLMARSSGVTSAAHEPDHIDRAVDAFDGTMRDLVKTGAVGP